MIEQRINLYQERFHEKRIWFSAGQVAALWLLAVVAGALYSLLLHNDLMEAEQQHREILASRDSIA